MIMKKFVCALGFGAATLMLAGASDSRADGFIDVQALTCAQLAGTFQEDADMLAAWYSGWYNGLAKKHFAHISRVKPGEHLVIVYCKQHPTEKVIHAIDVVLKETRK
jgi:hypothetical protein